MSDIDTLQFNTGDILTADDLNTIVANVKKNKLTGSYNSTVSITPNGQSITTKPTTTMVDSQSGAGVSPESKNTSTIENSPTGLRLFNAGKTGLANNVSPYIIEAIATGALPRNFISLPVLQNSPITDEILPSEIRSEVDLSEINNTLKNLLYPNNAEVNNDDYLESLLAATNGDKNNALLYGIATSFANKDIPIPDSRMKFAYDTVTSNKPLSSIRISEEFDLALSSTARTVNYLNMADVFSLTMPDSIARGQLTPYERTTSRSIGSMFIPLSGISEQPGEPYLYATNDYLSHDFRTGAQLYGFAVQMGGVEDISADEMGEYYYPYFNADTYNGLSPIKVTPRGIVPIQAEAGSESYVEHPQLRQYLSAHPTTPGELALGLRNGLDIVVRVHDQPIREKTILEIERMLSAYPDLSTAHKTLNVAEGLRTPMVSYIPANFLFSEVTGVFPVIEDVYWDPETHSLMKTYRYWEITNGKITAIKGGAALSSISYIDDNDDLVEKTIELPMRTIILQGVPEQI